MLAYVEAPNSELYFHWLALENRKARDYPRLRIVSDLLGYHGPIIVLNGGSQDAQLRGHIVRYCRAQVVPTEV